MRMRRGNQFKTGGCLFFFGGLLKANFPEKSFKNHALSGCLQRRIQNKGVCFGFAVILAIISLGWQPVSAHAAGGTKHLTLDEIIVTGDTTDEPMVDQVGVKKIEKGKNINIPDVLEGEPDIDIKRRALIGDTTDSVGIRGFSSNRIMLNINGRPVNACGVVGGYYIDWSTLPLDNIEKIEIIKGGSSVQYGNNALGGVVNLITKKPTKKPTLTFFGTYGGGDIDSIQNYRLTHTYKVGPLGYSLAGSYQKADPYLWNNDFEGKNFASSLYLDMPFNGQLTFGLQYTNSKRGFIRANRISSDPTSPSFYRKINSDFPLAFGETFSPYSGSAFTPGPGANWDKTKLYLDLGYSQPFGDALLEVKFYQNHEDREEKNYSSSAVNSSYSDGKLVLDRDVGSDRSYGGSAQLRKPFGDHEVLMGVEHKVLAYGDTTVNYVDMVYNNAAWVSRDDLSFKPSSEGICWGYYLQDTWRISPRFMLTGGVRYDNYKNKPINGSTLPSLDDDALTPKLTATYRVTTKDAITASLYQALRTPGLPESYWWAEGATKGEPTLKPEKNNAAELIYQHNLGKKDFVRLSTYYYSVDDYIIFRFDPSWRGVYNIDKATLYGASLDGRTTLTSWLALNLALTWQHSKKEGDPYDTSGLSDEIDYLPDWKASAGLEFKLPHKSVLNLTLRYVGERQTIYAYKSGWPAQDHFKLVDLDSFVTLGFNFKIPVGKHVELSCYGENLLGEDYQEQYGYPMPGMIIGASLKLAL